eukprot:COSAG05_NODE_15796_length_361_cov_0.583969_1_plen_70_part_10
MGAGSACCQQRLALGARRSSMPIVLIYPLPSLRYLARILRLYSKRHASIALEFVIHRFLKNIERLVPISC